MPLRKSSLILLNCACALLAPAQTDTTFYNLRAEPGVMVNSQGGSQNDLSIRGSAFNEAGLSLDGLTLRNPQTDHFNAELPIPAVMLSRPQVLTGIDNQGGHSVGTVNFDLLPVSGKKQVETGFGSDHRDWQSALVQHLLTEQFGLGVFAGRESAEGADYDDNDFNREYAGSHLQYRSDDTQVDLLAAHQEKEFGARGYYGADPANPANEKTEDTLICLAARKGDLNNDYLRGGAAWREFHDDYELPTLTYRNQNRSRVSSVFFDGRTLEVNGWALGWRADADEERIAGTGSGALGNHSRSHGGLSLLPQWRGDRLKVVAGVRGDFFSGEDLYVLPQAGLDYNLTDNLTAFISYTETVRLPSYTELGYSNLYSVGNSSLQPQTEQQIEAGFKGTPSEHTDWKIAAFYRRSENTIDWLTDAAPVRWTATDIGSLDVYGTEARFGWYPAQNVEMRLAHTWVYKDHTADDFGKYASRYALDYPEHLTQAALLWRPVKPVEIGTVQSLRWQTDNEVRENEQFGADSSFVVRFTPPQADYATLSFLLNNAWDDDFQTFPGQLPPERFAGVSLTLTW